jgi:CO/xanthine dehydrogenase Mo-binding subunit
MAEKKTTTLVGHNYTTPDLVAKVTGKAKYAEDYRVEGMLFAKLLVSPMPHARVSRLDTRAAEAIPGVKAILTVDDLPAVVEGANLGEGIIASTLSERGLTNEPLYVGEPVIAVAAVDEATAAAAIEAIEIEFEALPFVVDPIETLRPGSPNARTQGNVWVRPAPAPPAQPGAAPAAPAGPKVQELKWTDADFAAAEDGKLPLGKHTDEWVVGDLDTGFKQADLVLDETFVGNNTSHQPLETRTAMAYWQNGKLYMHCSTQSVMRTVNAVARWVGIEPANVVIISEYTGGGFGSKGSSSVFTAVAALLSKKANAPVMMRISREEEHNIGRARPAMHSRVKIGFRKDGRVTAIDGFVVVDNGPYDVVSDSRSAGDHISLCYQPLAMRWRTLTVLTNTPPRGAQRAPGGLQGNALMAPIMAKAARKLGIDELAIHRINAPEGKAKFGALNARGSQGYTTSAFLKNALDKGAELFKWEERKRDERQAQRHEGARPRRGGQRILGRLDGLRWPARDQAGRPRDDPVGYRQPRHRVDLRLPPRRRGNSRRPVGAGRRDLGQHLEERPQHLRPGRQPDDARDDARRARGGDRCEEEASGARGKELGGNPDSYQLTNGRHLRRRPHDDARAGGAEGDRARRQVRRPPTTGRRQRLHEAVGDGARGPGADGRGARQLRPRRRVEVLVAGFAEVEVDVETGVYRVLDFLAVADVGTVIHPRNLGGQILGGVMLGFGHAHAQHWVFDQQYGVAVARRFYQTKPPTILDAPAHMQWAAVEEPDPETPVGARGIGEAPVGAGFGAVVNAIAAAVGDEVFKRAPVTADKILLALENGRPMHEALAANV